MTFLLTRTFLGVTVVVTVVDCLDGINLENKQKENYKSTADLNFGCWSILVRHNNKKHNANKQKKKQQEQKTKLESIDKHTVQNKFQSCSVYRTKKEKQTIEQSIEYTINVYKWHRKKEDIYK